MEGSAGEAASLFDTADPATDIFEVVASGGSDSTIQSDSNGPSYTQSSTASELFSGTSEGANIFGAADGNPIEEYGQYTSWAGVQLPHTEVATQAGSLVTDPAYQSQHYQADSWNGQHGQVSGHGQAQPQASLTFGGYSSVYGTYKQPHDRNGAVSDPYAPQSQARVASPPSNTTHVPSYDPYRAAAQTMPYNYAPAQPAAPSYDPYKPAKSSTPNHDHAPSQPYASGSSTARTNHTNSVTAVPPAIAASIASMPPYRPKVSNAYDPPLPPPKQTKYTPSRLPYIASPPPGNQPLSPPPPRSPPRIRSPPRNAPRANGASGTSMHRSSVPVAPILDAGYTASGRATNGTVSDDIQREQPVMGVHVDGHAGNVSQTRSSLDGNRHADWTSTTASTLSMSPPNLPAPPPPHGLGARVMPPLPPSRKSSFASTDEIRPIPHGDFGHEHSMGSPPEMFTTDLYEGRERYAASDVHEQSVPRSVAVEYSSTYSRRDTYSPPSAAYAPDSTESPGSSSIHSRLSARRQSSEMSHSSLTSKSPSIRAYALSDETPKASSSRSYEPGAYADTRASPIPSVTAAIGTVNPAQDPYAPSAQSRNRSMSSSSTFSSISAVLDDPYGPSRHTRQRPSESSSQGSFGSHHDKTSLNGSHAYHPYVVQEDVDTQVLNAPLPTHTMYAPSPSLLGANDPLGRTSVRVPVISFGFGGKVVTCFHGLSTMQTGFDVALASRQSTDIKVYQLHKVIPESALDTSAASFPGPLFSDPGTPSTGLVRTGAATQIKAKKARVIKYLEDRAEEVSRGIGYFGHGSLERRRAEAKHILVNLLKTMVENDGRLTGSPQMDSAVRMALVPRLVDPLSDTLKTVPSLNAAVHGDNQSNQILSSPYLGLTPAQDAADTPVAIHTVRASSIDKIQDFLMRGDRRAACHYASDEKLWAHAMVIASSIDKDTWKEVVTEFIRTELSNQDSGHSSHSSTSNNEARFISHGREPLRVAYSLFAGQGPASVKELVTPKPLVQGSQTLQIPPSSMMSSTPMSASFSGMAEPVILPPDILAKWADTVAMIIGSPMSPETSSALTALGDQLASNQWHEAAHVCYLLSPQTSPMGGIGSSSRIVLLGSHSPSVFQNFAKDPDPIILSEIVEFAMSLATPSKGQEPFAGLPYLQAYRLIRAASLAELGHVQLATRYCEAISGCLNRNSPYIHEVLVDQLQGLSDRLVAAPQLDKSASWIGSKVPKPSLDSIGNWLEGRLTKFIAGDADSPHREENAQFQQQVSSGPFAHYSTISSVASSTTPSPQQSKADLTELPTSPPPFRTGSAMALRSSGPAQVVINRSSSAMDYIRPSVNRRASPIQRVSSASATQTSFSESSLYSQALNGYAFGSNSKQSLNDLMANENKSVDPGRQSESTPTNGVLSGAWWGSGESDAPTPTASSFTRVDNDVLASNQSGFISLMDDGAFSVTPTASKAPSMFAERVSVPRNDEEDDLGLGNSSHRAKDRENHEEEQNHTAHANHDSKEESKPAQATEKPELKSASSGSWLSRLWKRESTTAPIKANLGEQTSFYYDKELKRWVNKTAGADATQPAQPPPPPPRAQTASPGRSYGPLPSGTTPPPPPPARPATANAMAAGPPKPLARARSNLVPSELESGSTPPTPTSPAMPPPATGPPPAGQRSRATTKRPVRNRYVDVFQQQQAAGGN